MRIWIKRLMVICLAFIMLSTGIIGTDSKVLAASNSIKLTDSTEFVVAPGETTHIKLGVAATATTATNVSVKISDVAQFSFTAPSLKLNDISMTSIFTGQESNIEFDVTTKDTAKIGSYPVDIEFTYSTYNLFDGTNETITSKVTIKLKVQEEKTPSQLTVGSISLGNTNIGSKTNFNFTVKNEGEITAKSVYLTMDYGDSIEERYTAKEIKVGDLAAGATKTISLPISILSTTTSGRKKLVANFKYKTSDGEALTSAYNVYINLSSNATAAETPKLNVEDVQVAEGLKQGEKFTISVILKNIGGADAKTVSIAVDDTSIDTNGIIRDYFTDGISANTIKIDYEKTVKIPLKVSKYASGGLKAIKLNITYSDVAGNKYTVANTVYVDIAAAATSTPSSANLVISQVEQAPSQPYAGEQMEVSFFLENKGKVDASELKVYTDGLTANTFIPVNSEPYQYYEKLKAGEKIKITVPLIVSKTIVEGLNNVTIKYTYTGGEGIATIPIHNVQNDFGSVSKPKIIVSKYTTDSEELRAGSTFNFTFDLYNTNAAVSAKNISVTISQADNIFSPTQGSNSFFINKIEPGETVTNTLEMKVKSDATTKAYPVEIVIEYEYDGAEPNPTTGEIGETKTEKLNLQAIENARPVVDNVNVYSWDGPVMSGNPAYLSFEFYNMGKSQLNNVVATVEGGFMKSDGNMYFIGNVIAGSSSFVEFEVIPNMEGTVSGVLRVTYEDSNGDQVEFTKDFTAEVMPAGVINPGGVIDGGSGEVFNPVMPVAKAPILPVWAFVIIQILIVAIGIPVARKIVISMYKAKLRKKEQD